jgi:TRAP-type mannitol/chloroaromatic compound transport system permease small subunit
MSQAEGPATAQARRLSAASRFCDAVDRANEWLGLAWGYGILVVTLAVIYEVVARTLLDSPTTWSNETVIYVSAVAYLLGGAYAHQHNRHVRIDLIYERLSPKMRVRIDIFTSVFFFLYIGSLVWVGGQMAWDSFMQNETTGTPWNPLIWPVKMAIPLAAVLLILQGIANLLRETGYAERKA